MSDQCTSCRASVECSKCGHCDYCDGMRLRKQDATIKRLREALERYRGQYDRSGRDVATETLEKVTLEEVSYE